MEKLLGQRKRFAEDGLLTTPALATVLVGMLVLALPPARLTGGQEKGLIFRGTRLTEWAQRLKDADPRTRLETVEFLKGIGPAGKAFTPMLADALNDGDVRVRRAAADGLGKIGRGARSAAPRLLRCTK